MSVGFLVESGVRVWRGLVLAVSLMAAARPGHCVAERLGAGTSLLMTGGSDFAGMPGYLGLCSARDLTSGAWLLCAPAQ